MRALILLCAAALALGAAGCTRKDQTTTGPMDQPADTTPSTAAPAEEPTPPPAEPMTPPTEPGTTDTTPPSPSTDQPATPPPQ